MWGCLLEHAGPMFVIILHQLNTPSIACADKTDNENPPEQGDSIAFSKAT